MSARKPVHAEGLPSQRISVGITTGRLYTPALCGELNIRAERGTKPEQVTCPGCLRLMAAGEPE